MAWCKVSMLSLVPMATADLFASGSKAFAAVLVVYSALRNLTSFVDFSDLLFCYSCHGSYLEKKYLNFMSQN